MSRWWRGGFRRLVVLAALVGVVWFTPAGTGLLLVFLQAGVPGNLNWSWVDGTLAGPIGIRDLVYAEGSRELEIRRVTLDWSPRRLLQGELDIVLFHIEGLRWRDRSPVASAGKPRQTPSLPSFPIAVRVRDFRLEEAVFSTDKRPPFRIREARLQAALNRAGLEIVRLEAALPEGRIGIRGHLRTRSGGPELSMQLEVDHRRGGLRRARLRLEGPLERARLTGTLQLSAPQARILRFNGRIGWREDRIAWEALQVGGDPLLTLVSRGWWRLSDRRFDVRLDWQRIAWPQTGVPRWNSRNGSLRARGRLGDWRLDARLPVSGKALPEGVLRLQGAGDRKGMRIDRLEAEFLEGEWKGTGQVTWLPKRSWTLNLEGRHVNPGSWPDPRARAWQGRLRLALTSLGAWETTGPEVRLRIDALSGVLRERKVRATGEAHLRSGVLSIAAFEAESGRSRLMLEGTAGRARLDLAWRAKVDTLDDFLPGATGRLRAEGRLEGRPERARMTGTLEGNELRHEGNAVHEIHGQWAMGLDPDAPFRFRIRAKGIQSGAGTWASLQATGEGTGASHRVRFETKGSGGAIRVELVGGFPRPGRWEGVVRQAEWQQGPAGDWRLAGPVAIHWDGKHLEGEALCWIQSKARLCLQPGRSAQGEQVIRVRLQALPLRRLAFLYPRLADRDVRGKLDLTGRWVAGTPARGAGRLCLSAGSVRVRMEGQSRRDPFEGGCLALRLDARGFYSEGEVRLDARNGVRITLDLPGYRPGPLKGTQRLNGVIHLEMRRLDRLVAWLEGIDRLEGWAEGQMVLEGTVSTPRVRGSLQLHEGVIGLPSAGIDWSDVQLQADSDKAGQAVRLRFLARSGEGRLEAKGAIALDSYPHWRLALQIRGRDFQALSLPEAVVIVTPDLRIRARPGDVEITGTVNVPKARLRPREFSQPVRVSPDAVVVQRGREVAHERAWKIRARVRMVLGDAVDIEARGLKARLGGDLTVIEKGDGIALGRGSLVVREGTFRLQGTPLTIRSGRLLYADTPLENPGLEIVLEREAEDAVVRAHIGGTLREPTLSLSSEPPLPQTDRLSLLLTGKRAEEASPAQGRLLAEAAKKLGVAGGELLGARLKELFGLSDVGISLGDTLNEASLALGTWLSPRLYVSWTVSLFDPVAALRIRYRISRHLQLEVRSGVEGTGGDLLYTIEK